MFSAKISMILKILNMQLLTKITYLPPNSFEFTNLKIHTHFVSKKSLIVIIAISVTKSCITFLTIYVVTQASVLSYVHANKSLTVKWPSPSVATWTNMPSPTKENVLRKHTKIFVAKKKMAKKEERWTVQIDFFKS